MRLWGLQNDFLPTRNSALWYHEAMSKNSHAKHEQKEHHHENVVESDDYGPTFGEKHRTLIWVIIIAFIIFVPLTFAMFWLANIFNIFGN